MAKQKRRRVKVSLFIIRYLRAKIRNGADMFTIVLIYSGSIYSDRSDHTE